MAGTIYGLPSDGSLPPDLEEEFSARLRRGVHLLGLWGQSNMSGRGAITNPVITDPEHPRIFQVGSKTRTLRAATEPLDMHDTPSGIGPGLQVARHYLQSLPPGDVVVLVPSARGGTALSTDASPLGWRWGVAGNLAEQAVTQMNDAVSLAQAQWPGADVTVDGILWAQGETDSSATNLVPGELYEADLDALIAGVRGTFGADLPFVIIQMLPEALGTGTRDAINEVQSQTPYRVPGTGFTLSAPAGNSIGDGLHFNAAGQRINGANAEDELSRVRAGLAPVNAYFGTMVETIFADDFNRADGPVGSAPTGQEWTIYGSSAPTASVSANQLALGGASGTTSATVDTGAADGIFRFTAATVGDGALRGVFRYQSSTDHLMLSRESGSSINWALWKRVGNTPSVVFASTVPIVDGDRVEVRLNGTAVAFSINDVEVWSGTVADLTTATRVGAMTATGFTYRWDDMEFVTG